MPLNRGDLAGLLWLEYTRSNGYRYPGTMEGAAPTGRQIRLPEVQNLNFNA